MAGRLHLETENLGQDPDFVFSWHCDLGPSHLALVVIAKMRMKKRPWMGNCIASFIANIHEDFLLLLKSAKLPQGCSRNFP